MTALARVEERAEQVVLVDGLAVRFGDVEAVAGIEQHLEPLDVEGDAAGPVGRQWPVSHDERRRQCRRSLPAGLTRTGGGQAG